MRALAIAALIVLAALGARAEPFRIAVISDLNGSYGSTDYAPEVDAAVARIVELAPDVVISAGDMVAGQRRAPLLSEDEIGAMWTAFHAHVTDRLRAAGLPLLVTPGNHDASAFPGFEAERRAFDREWTARSPDAPILDGERYPFRYAVSLEGVLLIGLDLTVPGPLPADEMDWLRQILREERPRHRAAIVFAHLPVWPVSEGREGDVIGDPAFLALLREGGVDAFLSGHHHAWYPGEAEGVALIAQARLGGGARRLIGSADLARKAIGIVEIDEDGGVAAYALAAPDFARRIDDAALPLAIGAGAARVVRREAEAR
jgi:hypothetical protein